MSTHKGENHGHRDSGQSRSWLLDVAVRGNAQALGFSILITVSYGIVWAASTKPPAWNWWVSRYRPWLRSR